MWIKGEKVGDRMRVFAMENIHTGDYIVFEDSDTAGNMYVRAGRKDDMAVFYVCLAQYMKGERVEEIYRIKFT